MERLTELLHRGAADPATRHLVLVVQQIFEVVKPEKEVEALVATATRRGYDEFAVAESKAQVLERIP